MILSEYIKNLQEIEKERGGDLLVVYASDDEGNAYQKIYYKPSVGSFNGGEFQSQEEDTDPVDSVCVN